MSEAHHTTQLTSDVCRSKLVKQSTDIMALRLAIVVIALHSQHAFCFQSIKLFDDASGTALFMGRKKRQTKPKLTYAERLQKHREKLAEERGLPAPEPIARPSGSGEETPQELASKLVQAQRESVDMLTFVKDRVAALPYPQLLEGLGKNGYVVLDDFLGNDDVVTKMEKEAESLFSGDHMERDMVSFGTGEYFVAVKGGEDQYSLCPRTVEMVVSITKNMPPLLEGYDVNAGNCIASLRVADRKSRLAAAVLVKDGELPENPFDIVANDGEKDSRKISLRYYPNAKEWDGDGGITVKEDAARVSSKRDRLVLLRSDTCVHRREFFNGAEGREVAACLEVDFVANA